MRRKAGEASAIFCKLLASGNWDQLCTLDSEEVNKRELHKAKLCCACSINQLAASEHRCCA